MNRLDAWFQLSAKGTTVRTEVLAGMTSFAAMAYILAVNPSILEAAGMERNALVTVTALGAALGCFLMAGLANLPIALAPGMGMNAYFAFFVCQTLGMPWQAALGCVFWTGVLFLILSSTGIREKVVESVPLNLKIGVQAGIGFFIAFLGLQHTGLVVDQSATLVTMGDMRAAASWLAILGVGLTGVLVARRVPGGVLLAIVLVALVGCLVPQGEGRVTRLPSTWVSLPASPRGTSFALDLWYPFQQWQTAWPVIFAFVFVDLFDSLGTLVGVGRSAGLVDAQGRLPRMNRALLADAGATVGGAVLGTSPVTSYVESAAGVRAGGRTGLTTVVVGILFLVALVFTPIILAIPPLATGAALVVIGVTMIEGVRELRFERLEEYLPAVLTLVAMPLTFSISDGLAVGFITHVLLMVGVGRWREVHGLTVTVAALLTLRYVFL